MASLGNTIINGALRVNGKINSSDVISAPSFVGALTGNAATATKLATARTINGVSFDGSANITTANWGTARNIGIVNSDGTGTAVTVSVNGSGNVNLKLPATIKASLTGNAATATKATQDGSGNVITSTYVSLTGDQTITGVKSFSKKITSRVIGTATTTESKSWGESNLIISSGKNGNAKTYRPAIGFEEQETSDGTLYMRGRILYWCSSAAIANEIPAANTGYKILHTGNFTNTIGDVLLKSGGTMNETAQIQRKGGTSSSWYNGRDNALIKYNSYTGYNPLLSMKTTAGSWELGAYSDNKLHLSYITDANYTAKTNAQTRDFVFNVASNTITASIDGNAASATKLQTARNIAVTGSVSGNANFDGSANINISVNRKGATVGQGGSTNTKPWYKAASLSQKSGNNDNHIMFSVYSTYADSSTKVGILKIHLRTTGDGKWSSSEIVWLSKSNDISVSDFVLAHNTNVNPTIVELWCKCNQGYQGYNFDVISEGYRVGRNSEWTMYDTWTAGSQDAPTSGYTQQTSTLLALANPISGNAASATKLQTARTIGVSGVTGTAQSFNGTANIVIPITAVPASLLTGKSAIKGSEITNDKHWVPSSDASVTNFVSMTAEEYATNASGLATGTIVAITDGVEGYVTTQATSLTCDLPLDL